MAGLVVRCSRLVRVRELKDKGGRRRRVRIGVKVRGEFMRPV
jgi:hypothetical protein